MTTGSTLIANERHRQISEEGWTEEHDAQHRYGELVYGAICYALHAHSIGRCSETAAERYIKENWPWGKEWWKSSDDPIRCLEKAGALIAAEIDRLQAAGVERQG